MDDLVTTISNLTGIQPAVLVLIGGIIVMVCGAIGRAIPDDATGWQGTVRKVAKFVGFVVSPRISKGLSVNDVAKGVVASNAIPLPVSETESAPAVDESSDAERTGRGQFAGKGNNS